MNQLFYACKNRIVRDSSPSMKLFLRISVIIFACLGSLASAQSFSSSSSSALTFQHPRDQIALQLGAIQMGYTVPFQLVSGNATKAQQAANALLMGRNALAATVAKPAVKVQGFVSSPSVDTVEYRDQLYQAVEAVVTSPVVGSIKGSVSVVGSTKAVSVSASLAVPPNAYTIPVPYALEAATSVDAQALRDEFAALRAELVGAGVLNMIVVQGGTLPQSSELAGQKVSTFKIGKYEVTWDEWQEVRTWAVANGYADLVNVGAGSAGNHPVRNVSWYDVVKWINARSEKEGLTPVYQVSGSVYKTGQSEPTVDTSANGYRLPLEKEWEWASLGGIHSKGYYYSGSNNASDVAWFYNNSSGSINDYYGARGSWPVGLKLPNELGIFDMCGNVAEWCSDFNFPDYRTYRGASNYTQIEYCPTLWRQPAPHHSPATRNVHTGFRLAR